MEHHLEDHPTASNPGDRVSLQPDWLILSLCVGELTPETLTSYDPWDDPPSREMFIAQLGTIRISWDGNDSKIFDAQQVEHGVLEHHP